MTPQWIDKKERFAKGPVPWIVRATSSFPVPLSPRRKTGCVEVAAIEIWSRTLRISGHAPTTRSDLRRRGAASIGVMSDSMV
ncbi:MAG: hypothetical protein A2Y95_08295 [Deltaproteobacteria bacterium RBG_13_65_10]|nr:MAG: hypothetical protein A2Y95_08295 [Deltaproteobacteria bacterium RBG_13_65_10]